LEEGVKTSEVDPNTIVYFGNRYVPIREAQVGILTHALNYGTGVFEGIRGYWNDSEEQLFLLRAEEHYARWKKNCGILRIAVPLSPAELCAITQELCERNRFHSHVYVRPLAYKASARIGVSTDSNDAFAIVVVPFGDYLDSRKGLNAGVSSWRRVEDNAIPGRGKICGAYVNSVLAGDEARRSGYDEAIFLTEDGHVAEGAACNIFIVRNGALITPSVADNVLEGITRACVMELAREELKVNVVERRIDRTELYVSDEAFFCGTAFEVAPIVSVDRRPIGSGEIGPLTSELRRLYFEASRGNSPKYRKWLLPVHQSALAH
jgi:branched-chain amino acid aminotransferase